MSKLLILLFLVSCGVVTKDQITTASTFCADKGGITTIEGSITNSFTKGRCDNKIQFEITTTFPK